MVSLIVQALMLVSLYATFWFCISLIFRRNDIADVAWGIAYVLLIGWLGLTRPLSPVGWLMFGLVTLWGTRLSFHIGCRLAGKGEDFRYRQWREAWGATFYWRSFVQVYLLQGFLVVILSLPLFIAVMNPSATIGLWTLLGAVIWIVGFLIQAIADRQLARFIRERTSRDGILDTGLWRFSRHPNYFGEILMWWAIFIMIIPLPHGWIGIISPITICFLLIFVSGVPMLEKRYDDHNGYQAYKKRTSVLIPWWPSAKG